MAAAPVYGSFTRMEEGVPVSEESWSGTTARAQKSSQHQTSHDLFGTPDIWVVDHEVFIPANTLERKAEFIRKVYGILSVQMLATVLVAATLMSLRGEQQIFLFKHAFALAVLSCLGAFASIFGITWNKNNYPANYGWLVLFTVCEAVSIGTLCAVYQAAGYGEIVLNAFSITSAVFLGLTLFSMQTRVDFTPYSGILFALLLSLLGVSLLSALFGFTMGIVYSWLGAVLFSCFIVVDTQAIISKLGYDDYIIAAIQLYLDFLNLFLFILRILTNSNSQRD